MSRLIARIAAGLVLALVGLLWPMAQMLFAAHMTQHLLLVAVAAPLLVLGGVELRLPPWAGWSAFVAVFLFWHWPAAFRWAALSPATILLELSTVLLAGLALWSVALGRNALNDGARALAVTTAAVVTDLPGVVMLFSPRAFCTLPGGDPARFGLTPLGDQQLAGLLMWVPANLAFFGIATVLFARWIGAPSPVRP